MSLFSRHSIYKSDIIDSFSSDDTIQSDISSAFDARRYNRNLYNPIKDTVQVPSPFTVLLVIRCRVAVNTTKRMKIS